ncbi:hypothetical protein [Pelomicrobium methylotrophicum]|uniref:Alpha/beta hydrolase family protein n=1 Tax=Pelomicrobium methylotrophicum TaxID=2602750 RepID=A0A5C7EMF0_9PROT|nr:hypothetical protein [Pelomicrobium methylotrophicum]TXF12361.1 hypothetical protein FR698_05735 [Pelomicrobium methylotrophicum]
MSRSYLIRRRSWLLSLLALLSLSALAQTETLHVRTVDGTGITVTREGSGPVIAVWLPSEHGLTAGDREVARSLAGRGFEVWLADLHAARFLATVPSELDQIPPSDAVAVLAKAAEAAKPIVLIAGERGATLALQAADLWRRQAGASAEHLKGAILLSPNLYVATPDPGSEPHYVPATDANRIPVAIVQPTLSPWYWWLDDLKTRLGRHGAPVFVYYLQTVRDRFYFRDDATSDEHAMASKLPAVIESAWKKINGSDPS